MLTRRVFLLNRSVAPGVILFIDVLVNEMLVVSVPAAIVVHLSASIICSPLSVALFRRCVVHFFHNHIRTADNANLVCGGMNFRDGLASNISVQLVLSFICCYGSSCGGMFGSGSIGSSSPPANFSVEVGCACVRILCRLRS